MTHIINLKSINEKRCYDMQIKPLTALRFLAAFYVFLFHFHHHISPLFGIGLIDNIIERGAIGMSLFFILSGFVLQYNYGNLSLSEIHGFYLKRFSRIYPAYIFWSLIFFYLMIPHFDSPSSFQSLGKALLVITSDIFLIQAWFPHYFSIGTNGGTWSLSVEAFLYIIFPLIVWSLNFYKAGQKKLILSLMIAIFLSILPGLSYIFFDKNHMGAYSLPIYRLSEFLCGIILCEIYRKKILLINEKTFILLCLGFFIVFSFTVRKIEGFVTLNFIVIPFFLALMLWSAQIKQNKASYILKALESKCAQYLGKISYSFYLSQPIVFSAMKQNFGTNYNKFCLFFCFFTINLICACLSYELIEKYFYKIILNKKSFNKVSSS